MSTKVLNINANEVLDRAKEAFNLPSDAKLSAMLGSGRTNISAWRRRNVVPFDRLYFLARANNVDFDWIITGSDKFPSQWIKEDSASYLIEDFVEIPFYRVDISAGNGTSSEEEEFKPLIFRREFIDKIGLNPSDTVGANVTGDSMTPLIPEGSSILIDKSDQKMTDGKIYVFNADGKQLVKKIIVDFDGFIARSINNEEYADIQLSQDKIDSLVIVGRARLALPYIKL